MRKDEKTKKKKADNIQKDKRLIKTNIVNTVRAPANRTRKNDSFKRSIIMKYRHLF